MYVLVEFICIGWFEVWGMQRKRELQNEKFLPIAGPDPTTSNLIDWHSNQLRHQTILIVDMYR